MKCLPPADFQISEEETKKRRDFRDLCTFSIDPPGQIDLLIEVTNVQVVKTLMTRFLACSWRMATSASEPRSQ